MFPTKVRVCRDASGNKSCVFKVSRSLYERFSVVSNERVWNTLFGKAVSLFPERSSVVKLTSELNTVADNVVTLLEEIFRVFNEIRVSNIFGCNVVMLLLARFKVARVTRLLNFCASVSRKLAFDKSIDVNGLHKLFMR
jgi:hypothetical protein